MGEVTPPPTLYDSLIVVNFFNVPKVDGMSKYYPIIDPLKCMENCLKSYGLGSNPNPPPPPYGKKSSQKGAFLRRSSIRLVGGMLGITVSH